MPFETRAAASWRSGGPEPSPVHMNDEEAAPQDIDIIFNSFAVSRLYFLLCVARLSPGAGEG